MYESQNRQLSGLGLSLKPPAWLRNATKKAVSDTVNAATKAAKDAAAKAAQDAANRLQEPARSPVDSVNDAVAAIPGGWLTIAAVGVGALLLLRPRRG